MSTANTLAVEVVVVSAGTAAYCRRALPSVSTPRDNIASQHVTGEGSLFDVPPAAIGRFRVLHQVGAGTCGPVFRAVDPATDTPAAIKLFTVNLPPERLAGFLEALANFVTAMPPLSSAVKPLAAGLHHHTSGLLQV